MALKLQSLRSALPVILGAALFALGLYALYHLLRPVHPADVMAQIQAIPLTTLGAALGATAIGYGALVLYDWFGLRFIGKSLSPGLIGIGGFLGYAFGNTIGISAISGGAVRYRIYSSAGLNAFEVAAVSGYIAVALGVGLTLVGLSALAFHPGAVGAYLPYAPGVIRLVAGGTVVVTVAAIVWLSATQRSVSIRGFDLHVPPLPDLGGQLVVTLIDIAAASFALWILLPAGKPDFAIFVAIYAAATMVGVLSHVPGGVGVFETVVIGTLPATVPVGDAAAALLLFRLVYYIVPFALAFLLVALNEARLASGSSRQLLARYPDVQPALTTLHGLSPLLVAVVAFGFGVWLLLLTMIPSVRAEAMLFLFFGLPGVALAAALTLAVAGAGADRRRAEQALLRIRGADHRRIIGLSLAEAGLAGIAGTLIGLTVALMLNGLGLAGGLTALIFSAVSGLILAALAIVLPAWRAAGSSTVVTQRRSIARHDKPFWQRFWLDMILLALSGLFFWQTASTGYQVVLAPEGVPATAVDYKAFLSPALFWIGAALLSIRLVSLALGSGHGLNGALRPLAGDLAPAIASSLAHQRRRITLGVAMTALALAFGVSTAIFNTTYNGQAQVDAQLTNGADVTAFGTMADPAGLHIDALRALPGVAAAEPMQHRFAYVGADLQDLYGIDAVTVTNAISLSDAYFAAGTAQEILARLATSPDAVLVSQETVNDFQLSIGDTINLRLMSAADHQYHPVPFHFVGVAREFPTAPKDSFLVANAAYVAKMTGTPAAEYVLMRTSSDPAAVAQAARQALAATPGIRIEEIGNVSHIIGSSLTAVSLGKLTAIELSFAVLMAAAAAGLMLSLGFDDRRRSFAVLSALGARSRQLGAFLWAEGAVVIAGGGALGIAAGAVTAWMLVKLLTGVFDPPPEALALPWVWLVGLLLLTAGAAAGAVEIARRRMSKRVVEALRDM